MVLERKFSWKCFKHNSIFFICHPHSHFHPLQVENCDSNSRLVVDENDNDKFVLRRVNYSLERDAVAAGTVWVIPSFKLKRIILLFPKLSPVVTTICNLEGSLIWPDTVVSTRKSGNINNIENSTTHKAQFCGTGYHVLSAAARGLTNLWKICRSSTDADPLSAALKHTTNKIGSSWL